MPVVIARRTAVPPPPILPDVSVGSAVPFPAQENVHESVTFTIQLSGQAYGDVLVDYATVDGTAEGGTDYTAVDDTLTIPQGQVTGTVTVSIINDETARGVREFSLVISNARLSDGGPSLTIGNATGLARILDDDLSGESLLSQGIHPRLLLTPTNIETIRTKLSTSPYLVPFQAFVTYQNSGLGTVPNVGRSKSYAFLYALGTVANVNYGGVALTDYAERARLGLLALASGGSVPATTRGVAAVAYDWVYHYLSGDDRTTIVNWLKAVTKSSSSANVMNSNEGSYPTFAYHMVGLAIANDGIDDARAVEINDDWINEGARVFAASDAFDGAYSQGMTYAWHAPLGPTYRLAELYAARRSALGTGSSPWPRSLYRRPAWFFAHLLPQERVNNAGQYQLIRGLRSDINDAFAISGVQASLGILRLVRDEHPEVAELCQWLLDTRSIASWPTTGSAADERTVCGHFIAGEDDDAVNTAPLSDYFYGHGMLVWRSGFDYGGTYTRVMAKDWNPGSGTYGEWWNGDVNIYRNGPVLVPSGHTTHHNYSSATFAHNTFGFPEWQRTNSGLSVLRNVSQLVRDGAFDMGRLARSMLFDGSSVLIGYACVTCHNSYQTPAQSQAVQSLTRQVLWIPRASENASDRWVIFDRVKTQDPATPKVAYWHPGGSDFSIDGDETPGPSRGATGNLGKWTYTGNVLTGGCNLPSGAGGISNKFYMHFLLPANRQVIKVGGPNRDGLFWRPSGNISDSLINSRSSIAVTTLTRSGTTATLTLASNHGVPASDTRWIRVFNATPSDYNGFWEATSQGGAVFTFTLPGDPGADATGAGFQWDWSHEWETPSTGLPGMDEVKTTSDAKLRCYMGTYRVEVHSADVEQDSRFLTVVEAAGDHAFDTPVAVSLLQATGLIVTQLGDVICGFSAAETQVTPGGASWVGVDSGSIVVPSAGVYRVLLADLSPSAGYTLHGESGTTSAAGVLDIVITTTGTDEVVVLTRDDS